MRIFQNGHSAEYKPWAVCPTILPYHMKNPNMAPSYKHDPLPEGRFTRLLQLYPARNSKKQLCCNIFNVSLGERGSRLIKYEALSYVWGSPMGDRPLAVGKDKKILLITRNCETALRSLRLSSKKRTLWIDSICIDQQAIDEKSHQTSLMGDIYGEAWRTLIWLGPEHEEILSELQGMEQYTLSNLHPLYILGLLVCKKYHDKWMRMVMPENANIERLRALNMSNWLTRVWTLQELVLSPHPHIVSRSGTIPWDQFMTHMRNYFIMCRPSILQDLDIVDVVIQKGSNFKFHAFSAFETAAECREIYKRRVKTDLKIDSNNPQSRLRWKPESDVAQLILLDVCRSRESTDPRDKIYALYRVFLDCGFVLPAPDYRKTVAEVFEEVTIAVILYSGSLRILETVMNPNRQHDLPSWVPDYTDQSFRKPSIEQPPLRSSRSSFIWARRKVHQLQLRGMLVGIINSRHRKMEYLNFNIQELMANTETYVNQWETCMETCMETLREWYEAASYPGVLPEGKNAMEELEFTLTGYDELDFEKQATISVALYQISPLVDQFLKDMSSTVTKEQKDTVLKNRRGIGELFFRWYSHSQGKSPFITDQGMMALGENDFQVGDAVVLCHGAKRPMILRQDASLGLYRLVGFAYVHGIPKRIWKRCKANDRLERFTLI